MAVNFTPVTEENFRHIFYKKTKNMRLIEAFIESDETIAKVESDEKYTAANITATIKSMKYGNVRCFGRGGEIYLVRSDRITDLPVPKKRK